MKLKELVEKYGCDSFVLSYEYKDGERVDMVVRHPTISVSVWSNVELHKVDPSCTQNRRRYYDHDSGWVPVEDVLGGDIGRSSIKYIRVRF